MRSHPSIPRVHNVFQVSTNPPHQSRAAHTRICRGTGARRLVLAIEPKCVTLGRLLRMILNCARSAPLGCGAGVLFRLDVPQSGHLPVCPCVILMTLHGSCMSESLPQPASCTSAGCSRCACARRTATTPRARASTRGASCSSCRATRSCTSSCARASARPCYVRGC